MQRYQFTFIKENSIIPLLIAKEWKEVFAEIIGHSGRNLMKKRVIQISLVSFSDDS